MRRILSEGFAELGLDASREALERFQRYYEYLTARNKVMNLTAIEGKEQTARLHFLDCAALLTCFPFEGKNVIDVGSGAGFPGLPLKILAPGMSLTLLDSQKKRVAFLEELAGLMGLENVSCVAARAEELAINMRGSFDIAVSRAVARLNILCELCLPFVKPGGVFMAMKGPDCAAELEEAASAVRILGGGKSEVKSYRIPGTDIVHSCIIIRKAAPAPDKYPRQFGQIKKSPL